MKRHNWMPIAACACSCSLAATASGDDCDATLSLIGDGLDVSTGITDNLGGVSVAYNSVDNEYLVAWFDSRIEGQNNVYAQRVSASGALLGINLSIIAGSNSQTHTAVAYSEANNEYFVTWRNQSGGPGSPAFNHTFGRVVSASGHPITSEVDVSNAGLEATLAWNLADNEYVLEARNFAGGGAAGIYARRVSNLGLPLGGNIIVSTAGAPAPAGQIAYNGNARQLLATWRNQSDSDLRGRIINGDGSFAGPEFLISTVFPASGLVASAAFDPVNDRYLVVFGTFSGGQIMGQFVASWGAPEGPLLTLVDSGNTLNPFVARDAVNGVFLLAWRDGGNISARLLSDQGDLLGDPVAVVTGSAAGDPRLAANTSDSSFIVAWENIRNRDEGHRDTVVQLVGVAIDGPCVGDLDCDGVVGIADFLLLLAAWGTNPGGPPDFDGDGDVGVNDFLELLAHWGPCP
ncbi:MAG: hypothetical protein ACYTGM_11185 [Planctomycetota bacterium]|jgi:hypothetical protein